MLGGNLGGGLASFFQKRDVDAHAVSLVAGRLLVLPWRWSFSPFYGNLRRQIGGRGDWRQQGRSEDREKPAVFKQYAESAEKSKDSVTAGAAGTPRLEALPIRAPHARWDGAGGDAAMRHSRLATVNGVATVRRLLPAPTGWVCLLVLLPALPGCTPWSEYIHNGFKVGPNYHKPPAPVAPQWIDADDARVRSSPADLSAWWKVFNDQQMNNLVCVAYSQNLTLREAGFRVLQARAERAIAIGELFPQTQEATGDYVRSATSRETARGGGGTGVGGRFNSQWDFGFNLSWELDFWGRFRRAVESANANLDASVDNYDDALVTLIADVASAYVEMCTTQQRLKYARENIDRQSKLTKATKVNPNATTSDYDQALSILRQTEALVPQLLITLRQANDRLCMLLGIPPEDLQRRLVLANIPTAPPDVVIGIPADLLRRRPDVRRAERQAATQSALIGVAEAEFYPHIAINGTLGYSAALFKDLFRSDAMTGTIGPTLRWNILNYGRILNGVRRQDAIFLQQVLAYQNTVLVAGQEVEDALAVFLQSQEQYQKLRESANATEEALKVLSLNPMTTVFQLSQLQQNLVQQRDQEAVALGNVAQGLIQVYRALGGGWELRLTGCDPHCGSHARLGGPEEDAPNPRRVPGTYRPTDGPGGPSVLPPAN
jgi:NodT family efflux transporter outer membrane factor (OMF) lipoprotein